ncbi:alpha/beta fold hydrolase [Sulfurifustis variabilis]|nr:lysophospholipase [Sulfurifustis variabilis]
MIEDGVATLVLMPGLDGTGLLFERFVGALPNDIPVRTLAYPRDVPLSLPQYAELAARDLPSGRTVLLAESFSSLVALALLAGGAVSPRAIVFCAGFAEPPRPLLLGLARMIPGTGTLIRHAPDVLLRYSCLGGSRDPALLAWLRSALARVSPVVLEQRLALIGQRRRFFRERCTVPCHYLQAGNDRLVPAGAARWFDAHFASCNVQRIEGPHFLLQTRPEECARRVTEIVRTA